MKELLQISVIYFFEFLNFLIFVRIILSWFPIRSYNRFVILIYQLTDPILEPFRKLSYKLGLNMSMVDISPIFAYIFLQYILRPVLLQFVAILF